MPIQASYIGIEPRTQIATAADQARGIRVTLNSSGLTAASAIGVRGDYVTLTAITASTAGAVASMSGGGKVPALASEAVAVGDAAYSAANGKFSKTSTNAVLVGKWTMAASGDGVLGEVELQTVA
jgi:hypothetical protein